jgi:hypothetical protein
MLSGIACLEGVSGADPGRIIGRRRGPVSFRRAGFPSIRGLLMRSGAVTIVLAVLLLIPCWGCGTSAGHYVGPTVPVKGKITYKGKALTQGDVVFEPVDSGREAHGSIQPDGTFELTTFNKGDGAVPGTHRVAVSGTTKKDAVPLKYKNPSSSKTEVEVAEGKTEYTVDLK